MSAQDVKAPEREPDAWLIAERGHRSLHFQRPADDERPIPLYRDPQPDAEREPDGYVCSSCGNAWADNPGPRHWVDDEGQETNCGTDPEAYFLDPQPDAEREAVVRVTDAANLVTAQLEPDDPDVTELRDAVAALAAAHQEGETNG